MSRTEHALRRGGQQPARYPNVMQAIVEEPWAIRPEKLVAILECAAARARGEHWTQEEIDARIGGASQRRQPSQEGAVAVLPIFGVLVPRGNLMTQMSGASSVQQLMGAFSALIEDDNVSGIVLDIDSPGGQTQLISEFATMIRDARGIKPVTAVANGDACSAAYWLAVQADEVVVSPSSKVGSIGVFTAHEDISGQQEQDGIKTTLVSAGKFKTELSPFEPLSDDARAFLQQRVEDVYEMFVTDVGRGRGVAADTVRKGFGEGRTVLAKDALRLGMADRIGTLEDEVGRLQVEPPPQQPGLPVGAQAQAEPAQTFADEAQAAHAAAERLVTRASSLAEVRRGRLTAAKREQLTASADAFQGAADALAGLLADTDPARHRAAVEQERTRFLLAAIDPRKEYR